MDVNGRRIDYAAGNYLPKHMQGGMRRYVENRIPPGSFLLAVLSNDLMRALSHADHINIHRLPDYGKWLYNHAPRQCYGSAENVAEWLERKD